MGVESHVQVPRPARAKLYSGVPEPGTNDLSHTQAPPKTTLHSTVVETRLLLTVKL